MLLILVLFLPIITGFQDLKLIESEYCKPRFIQFINPLIEDYHIKKISKRVNSNNSLNIVISINETKNMEIRIKALTKEDETISELYLEDVSMRKVTVCIGEIETKYLEEYNVEFQFIIGHSFIDMDDSSLLPNIINITFVDKSFTTEYFFYGMCCAIILGYIAFLLVIFLFEKRKKIVIPKKVVYNIYEYQGNFKEMIKNRYNVLKDEPYPSADEIINLPKYKSRRDKIISLRENKVRKRRRHNVERKRRVKKSKDTIVKRTDGKVKEKIKLPDSNLEIRGPSKIIPPKIVPRRKRAGKKIIN
uniref:Uncharacterized protein n=1 Tax=Parastrongyloides trichosuri TaxID=131310 RepID=A0A0N4ZQ52_PARTI